MFARVTRYHGSPSPGRVQEGSRVVSEITPEMQQMQGFQRAYLLVDGKGGNAFSVSLWGTEEEATRSTAPTSAIRDRIAHALGAPEKPQTEIMELAVEVEGQPGVGKFARLSEYRGSPGKAEEGIRAARATESDLKRMPGFDRVFLFLDRRSGRAITVSFWDSEDAMNRSGAGVNPLRDSIARGLGATTEKPTVETYEVAGDIPQRARRAA